MPMQSGRRVSSCGVRFATRRAPRLRGARHCEHPAAPREGPGTPRARTRRGHAQRVRAQLGGQQPDAVAGGGRKPTPSKRICSGPGALPPALGLGPIGQQQPSLLGSLPGLTSSAR